MDIPPSNSNIEFHGYDFVGYEEARQRVNIMIQFLAAEESSGERFHLSIRRPSHLDRDVVLLTHYDGPWSRVLPCTTDTRRLGREAKPIAIFEALLMALVGNGESAGLGRPEKIFVSQAWLADMFSHIMATSDIPQNVIIVREATMPENDRIASGGLEISIGGSEENPEKTSSLELETRALNTTRKASFMVQYLICPTDLCYLTKSQCR